MTHARADRFVLAFVAGIALGCRGTAPTQPSADASTPACASVIDGADRLGSSTILLGEQHGTSEIPALFADLVCDASRRHPGQTVLVGLELPGSAQPAIDRLLAAADEDTGTRTLLEHSFWHRDLQDGRSSQAMLALIKRLGSYRARGMKCEVRAIDNDTGVDRDAFMAAKLSEAVATIQPAQTMVLVGDVHSRVITGYPWKPDDPYRPLARLLRDQDPGVLGLYVRWRSSGTCWTCTTAMDCGPHPVRGRPFEGSVPSLTLDLDAADKAGWSGTLFVESVSASPPAIGSPSGG